MKSDRNKTIDFSVSEGRNLLSKTVSVYEDIPEICDKTVLGDAFAVLPHFPREYFDLLIVDPPYNLNKNFGKTAFHKKNDAEYADFCEKWIEAVKPTLKKTASVYVCCDWETGTVLAPILRKHFCVRNRITWQREKGRGAKKNWKNGMEDIYFATVSDEYYFNLNAVKIRRRVLAPYKQDGKPKDWEETENGAFRNTCPSNFWDDISVPYWSMPENTAHPTQKPEKLLAKMILASSKEGDRVLDIFAGSGSTAVTAKKLGRHYVGIEINEQYCAWTEKRLENAEKDKSIQGFSDGVFWERNTRFEQKKRREKL